MLMSHLEEPKVTEDEEPPTEQDKRKKMVSYKSSSNIWESHVLPHSLGLKLSFGPFIHLSMSLSIPYCRINVT